MNLGRPFWITLGISGALALILLWADHETHILGALPWLVLLACPLMHLFMHHGHHDKGSKHNDDDNPQNF